jgi:hypothetical protein
VGGGGVGGVGRGLGEWGSVKVQGCHEGDTRVCSTRNTQPCVQNAREFGHSADVG